MGHLRGIQADCPCPRCLVEREQQSNFLKSWPLRDMDTMRDILDQAADLRQKDQDRQAEYLLKEHGLRELDVS